MIFVSVQYISLKRKTTKFSLNKKICGSYLYWPYRGGLNPQALGQGSLQGIPANNQQLGCKYGFQGLYKLVNHSLFVYSNYFASLKHDVVNILKVDSGFINVG